jgi:hypothetical protein
MKAPICRLCGVSHWLGEGHRWPASAPAELVAAVCALCPGEAVDSSEVKKGKFDRVAYQREYMRDYMRKRRAKKGGGDE